VQRALERVRAEQPPHAQDSGGEPAQLQRDVANEEAGGRDDPAGGERQRERQLERSINGDAAGKAGDEREGNCEGQPRHARRAANGGTAQLSKELKG
jgi:hypothetical protein